MANVEQLAALEAGAASWNAWRQATEPRLVDLSHAVLRARDFSHANLAHADFAAADLTGTDLSNANLSGADLSGTDLSRTNFGNANLTGANLTGADVTRVNFGSANIVDTNFEMATLGGTVFAAIDLRGAEHLDTCIHRGPSFIDLSTLDRSGPLPIVFLRGCGLSEVLIEYLPSILNRAIGFYSCFISYNHADQSFARRLHDQLQRRGIRCWLDEHQMRPGDDIRGRK